MKNRNMILVPHDFSKVADCAVNHAIKLANTLPAEVNLLHLVAKEKQVDEAREKLQKIADDIAKANNIQVHAIVEVGNIFDDIGEVAKKIAAKLIIMGTHGVKGFQHITGSHALKVITNSEVPFVVVQEKNIREGYLKIVLPLDVSKDTKHKLKITVNMAKYFHSKISIIAPYTSDEFDTNALTRNLNYTKAHLNENKISYTVTTAEKGSFAKAIIKHAIKEDADLIAIVNEQDSGLPEFVSGPEEQQIITNEAQIPVLCVNPTQNTLSRGVLFS